MVSETWFESWFDSPLYEKLYANRDDAEAAQLVSLIAAKLSPKDYPQVLDLGCGRGRHAFLLASKGYRVTGVDLSSRAIEKARRKVEEENIPGVVFETGDMRSWRSTPFDLVCNLFTSFGYFDDDDNNLRVINNMEANLKQKGYLVMDYLNPSYVREKLVPVETVTIGDMTCRISRHIENSMVVKTLSFLSTSNDHSVSYQERVKLYNLEWFESVFARHHMKITRLSGDYSGGGFHPQHSARMVMMVKKEGL